MNHDRIWSLPAGQVHIEETDELVVSFPTVDAAVYHRPTDGTHRSRYLVYSRYNDKILSGHMYSTEGERQRQKLSAIRNLIELERERHLPGQAHGGD